ncbi:sigma 54-interacting transcriptional regulator [Microbulbifer spongiae]|uniref:Sigma 54-interacting transcriptional regulator n=1 Tax=Microbulbifer spongiae TaxID=2944933 RepID=A0ABY9ECT0_9GAMM|nr:sigma 54-interacting transcriptional regulator [Microbulbifer sp. MI-G]WKD50790.1 sigma 54-interacting transcriptional regulator [Microbulbifer sp. MI-G]
MSCEEGKSDLLEDTLNASNHFQFEDALRLATFTIIWHPKRHRIGASAHLLWDQAGKFELSRWTPRFQHGDNCEYPLDDRRISRSPVLFRKVSQGIVIHPPNTDMPVQIGAMQIENPITLEEEALEEGVVFCLGRRITLCLHWAPPRCPESHKLGLVGSGHQLQRIGKQIRKAAQINASVLIRGESGTGKELVAHAIHDLSSRCGRSMVCVNMATLGGELAVAELFGVRQGAYTGARANRPGLIGEAHGSTLFMDEIGDAQPPVQAMLLRVLESGTLRALGDSRERNVDVRFIAATDRPLEAGSAPSFSQPLRRRLEAVCIQLPPLRRRREDFGELLLKFLVEAECELEQVIHLPADLVCILATRSWPGNVRELKNFVTRLTLYIQPDGTLLLGEDLAEYLQQEVTTEIKPAIAATRFPARYRDPATVSESDLLQALNTSGWRIMPAARTLGISRTSMYALLKHSTEIRFADAIAKEEIQQVMQEGSDLDAWAEQLKTPREGLKRRLNALALKR